MFSSSDQPEFIDNRRGNTLAAAITTYLLGLDDKLAANPTLDVVTGYFNPRGYFAIADGLERVEHLRLLIGAGTSVSSWTTPGSRSICMPLVDVQRVQTGD